MGIVEGGKAPGFPSEGQHRFSRLIARRIGDGHLHAGFQAADDKRVHHVVPVANEAQLEALQCTLLLPYGHKVGKHLAGMAEIRQPVDNGNAAPLGQSLYLRLLESADHDAIQVPGKNPGGVLHRLATANLQIVGRQKQRLASQLVHSNFKGHPGAGGSLLKNHTQGFTRQMMVRDPVLIFIFQLVSEVQNLGDFRRGEIQQL